MKGIIVQVGEPKSIVMLNNGRICAIPTPGNCRVGMVVTVKYRDLWKIIAISAAAVLLVVIGIFIGLQYSASRRSNPTHDPFNNRPFPMHPMDRRRGPMMERFRNMEDSPRFERRLRGNEGNL